MRRACDVTSQALLLFQTQNTFLGISHHSSCKRENKDIKKMGIPKKEYPSLYIIVNRK